MEDTDFIIITLLYMLKDDFYLKRVISFIVNIKGFFSKDVLYKFEEHKKSIKSYIDSINEVIKVIETKNKRDITDLKIAYYLSFFLFIVVINDMQKEDFELLNKGHYSDGDFKCFDELKKDIRISELSLIYKNRIYNKKNKEE